MLLCFVIASLSFGNINRFFNATELACQSLNCTEGEELRADIFRILRQSKTPKANLTKEEFKAMKELKSDWYHIIPTADKGVAVVVMDKMITSGK